MVQILIFCRSYLIGEGLKKLVEESETISVVAIGTTMEEFEWMSGFEHDLIVCDGSIFESMFQASHDKPLKFLLISDGIHPSSNFYQLQDLVKRGLVGVLGCKTSANLLPKAIHAVIAGEMWIDHETMQRSLRNGDGNLHDLNLTRREKQVLSCVCSGASNREIAEKLFVTEQTVKSHCNTLFKKFGVKNRVGLALKGKEALGVLELN